MQHTAVAIFDRRSFLKLSFAGSAVLATAGLGAMLAGCSRREQAAARGFVLLRDADLELLRALLPALLEGAPLDEARTEETLRRIDGLCARFQGRSADKLRQLFDLLNLSITRRLTTGVSTPWASTPPAQVATFLDRWRASSVGLFNLGHSALAQLAAAGYFGQPGAWSFSGYPGPLASVYRAANS
jgi:hypothetical protein